MDKKLYRKLLRTALFSSPIMAVYGVTPVYIFDKIPGEIVLYAGTGLMINVFIFWFINIWIIRVLSKRWQTWKWYLLSYTFSLLSHFLFIFLRSLTVQSVNRFREQMEELEKDNILLIYPVMSLIAINTIILIICNSILLSQKKKNAELEVEHLKVSNLEASAKVLMQQLQPHFLFNTLSVLKSRRGGVVFR
jgi:two-component system, LytTR family, sensor kinase